MSTYYDILALPPSIRTSPSTSLSLSPTSTPFPCLEISAQVLRTAYKRALLRNHPDKAGLKSVQERDGDGRRGGENGGGRGGGVVYSVDQITRAFKVLSDVKMRREYDRNLLLGLSEDGFERNAEEEGGGVGFRTGVGVEVVDLDELLYVHSEGGEEGVWYRDCRCGEERGFEVTEEDLDMATKEGEVGVGCKGCSLWLRVLFAVLEEG